MDFYQGRVQ